MSEANPPRDPSADDLIAALPFLAALSPGDRSRLVGLARVRSLGRGQPVWRLGAPVDEFLFVVRGRVKLINVTSEGREAIVDLRDRGQLLCSGVTGLDSPYCCSAVAHVDDVEIVGFPREETLALIDKNPAVARAFMRETAACTVTLCRRVEELASGGVERRLAMLLLRLADHVGQAAPDGVWIPVGLSRQDLADLCNSAVETAIRTMSRLAKDGIVETRPGGFLLRDRAALAALAE
jgi:CRP-like cAMP-binding protein